MRPGDISNDVLVGEDGWLFLWQGAQHQFDMLSGRKTPHLHSVTNFCENLVGRSAMCRARGLPYLHVTFPSKPVVMTDNVPLEHRSLIQSLYERCYADEVSRYPSIHAIYPRSLLLEERSRIQVFRQKDTHMSHAGAAVIAREMLRSLGERHDPQELLSQGRQLRHSDLSVMMGDSGSYPEQVMAVDHSFLRVEDNRTALRSNTNNMIILHNPVAVSSKRLLTFGDSFMVSCLAALSTFYTDIMYVRSDLWQPDLLDLFAPDVVISSNAERYLSAVRRDQDAESILLTLHSLPDYSPAATFTAALCAQLSKRSYPAVYSAWQADLDRLCFYGLGVARFNDQIVPKERKLNAFKSTNSDPQIVFLNASIEDGAEYELTVNMTSGATGTAQLFWGLAEPGGPLFAEYASAKQMVSVGENRLVFKIPSRDRTNRLRFDPLNCPGDFDIRDVSLTRLL